MFERTNDDGTTTKVSCAYDHMGRRATKKLETISTDNSRTTLHQRYLYRNYLHIACCDLTRTNHPHLWFLAWDPTQPTATRPLALRKDGTWYCYGWDLTKNICEVFSNDGCINNTVTYSYTPYGAVTAEGTVQQAIQWSSEFYDDELGLVYYNYRHYNPENGRWCSRDFVETEYNVYIFSGNDVLFIDILGLSFYQWHHVLPREAYKTLSECLKEFPVNSKENGVFVTEEMHRKIHRKKNGGRMWNSKVIEKLNTIKDSKGCCIESKVNEFREELKKLLKDEYDAFDTDISKDDWDKKSPVDKDRHTGNKPQGNTSDNSSKGNDSVKDAGKTAERLAVKITIQTISKIALRFAAKKLPVIGWGYAAYGAYRGYKTGGIVGAAIGAVI